MSKITKKGCGRLLAGLLAGLVMFTTLPAAHVTAATEQKDSVTMRLVFTTDLHGTVGCEDYISGIDYENQGLAKAINLVRKTREEMPKENVITLDVGDFLFNASMEYIYGQDPTAIQPIVKAMTYVGYDAMILGNHEFDYGKKFLLQQLSLSGLIDKVVVSNLMNEKDNSFPFHENMLIEREAVTAEGKKTKVTVGIIGETVPTLSTKTDNYAGVYTTEDILSNVRKEAKILRDQGADVIVVAAHSGFGKETPNEKSDNVVYAMTKEDGIDVILCGHEHVEYPSENSQYNNLSGVDPITKEINGKVVVMAANNGKSIGVSDITLSTDEAGEKNIIHKSGHVRRIADYSLEEDPNVLATFSEWEEELSSNQRTPLITIAEKESMNNYLGVLRDNPIIQLLNDARIAYARKYIQKSAKEYAEYPIIAASTYNCYGANSWDDFININGTMNYGNLFELQDYRNMTYLYKVTGAQLKEWLELSASAYRQLTTSKTEPLLSDHALFDWSRIYLFDGINYTISPYAAPRYNEEGRKVSNSERITALTYQGKPVTDTMVFVVAANTLKPFGDCFTWAPSQIIRRQYRSQVMVQEYLTTINKKGDYTPVVDNNWSLSLKEGQKFLALVSLNGVAQAKADPFYNQVLNEGNEFSLVQFVAGEASKVLTPYVVIAPQEINPTMLSYPVYVDAYSPYGMKTVRYSSTYYSADSYEWRLQREVVNQTFQVYFNSNYYVYAEDEKGNRSVTKVIINNIGVKEMAKPKVYSFHNMKSSVTGTGEVMATVVALIDGKEYTSRVQSNGNFSVAIPEQEAGTSFTVYQKDTANNRKSDAVKVYVKKNGPSTLTADKFYNNMQGITGFVNDEDSIVIAVVDQLRTIYVPEGEKDRLLLSESLPTDSFNIVEVKETIDEDGRFLLELPDLDVKTTVKLYNMDLIGRLSRSVNVTVLEGGPYAPSLSFVNNMETTLYGSVKSVTSQKALKVTVTAQGKSYSATADDNGYFQVELSKPLEIGEIVTAYAVDTKSGRNRKGRVTKVAAVDATLGKDSDAFDINPIAYDSYGAYLTYKPYQELSVIIPYLSGNVIETYETDSMGALDFDFTENLREGAEVVFLCRDGTGELLDCASKKISYRIPENVVILNYMNNTTKALKLFTKEDHQVNVTIGDVAYKSEHGIYDKTRDGYIHTIPIVKADSGTKVTIQVQNVTSYSEVRTVVLKKKAPDTPVVEKIKENDTVIIGKVDVFLLNSKDKATVKNSNTKVYAKINEKLYRGTIEVDGSYCITVPSLSKGLEVKIFAYNKYGYGPIKVIEI